MNIIGERRRSGVDDVIKYELIEYPPWRKKNDSLKSVQQMINAISKYHAKWDSVKKTLEHERIKQVVMDMEIEFCFHVNNQEGTGLDTLEDTRKLIKTENPTSSSSKSEQEVFNVWHASQEVKNTWESTEEATPLLEEDILKSVHALVLKGINKQGNTKPGEYSSNARYTEYKGEIYKYTPIGDLSLEDSVRTVLDRYNALIEACKTNWENYSQASLTELFKIAAYLLFEMLDVHPFSDGNERLIRLLVSHVLFFVTPFPSSVHNLWSDVTNKDAYLDAIVETRNSPGRKPHLLAAMIAECNWFAWRMFFKNLEVDVSRI